MLGAVDDSRVVDVPWDPEASDGLSLADSQGTIAGAEAVVNLAGASIAEREVDAAAKDGAASRAA